MSSEEIAYRDLEPGELYQDGDEWLSAGGCWIKYVGDLVGTPHNDDRRSRRPYNITRMTQERDRLAHAVNDLLKKNHHLTKNFAQLQQSQPAADHIADVSKMVESELERMAWELYSRLDVDEEGAFRQAIRFIAERNRRRQAGITTTGAVGD